MAFATITDFKYGMDRRRERVAGIPGTLWLGENVHISRGGDVEGPKKFVLTYSLPDDTFGMGQVRGQLYVFGSVTAPTMPTGVQYQRLQSPDGAAMTEVLDVDTFDGKFYVIARFANGHVYHFYDGARVSDWDTVADATASFALLTSYLADLIDADANVSAVAVGSTVTITARTAGTAFTISKSTTDYGGTSDQDITLTQVTANVAAVAEVQATSAMSIIAGTSGTIQGITANGVSLMRSAVTWATSHTATAAAIATSINNKTATHGYTAQASGANITLTAGPGTGDTPNEYVVAASVTGDVVISTPTMSGGVDAVTAVAQVYTAALSGTFQAADLFSITINGTVYSATGRAGSTGLSAFVHKKRMWSPANSLWRYSRINTVNDWTNADVASGAGFINIANETEGAERLVGAAPYGTQAAVFSRNSVQIFDISTDAEENAIAQPLGNTGALAARAILPYGNLDVFYLDEPGIRSLRARDTTGEAFAHDIGHAIDPFIRGIMDSVSEAVIRRAVSIIGPEGRFMMALGEYIFVLSYFPGSKITAWSYYRPGFSVSDFARIRNKLYARSGDTIYLYGGAAGSTYPDDGEMTSIVETPFMTAQQPGTDKRAIGFDIACVGEWDVKMLINPEDERQRINIGRVTGTTYQKIDGNIAVPGETTHFAFRLAGDKAGRRVLSNLTFHYAQKAGA